MGPTPVTVQDDLRRIYQDCLTLKPQYPEVGELCEDLEDMMEIVQEVVTGMQAVPDQLPLEEQERDLPGDDEEEEEEY